MDYFTRLSIRKERSTQLLRSVEINIFRLSPLLSVVTILDQRAIDAMRAQGWPGTLGIRRCREQTLFSRLRIPGWHV